MDYGYGKFSRDIQDIRNALVYLDTLAINPRFSQHAKINKALTLVWMGAALENFWKSYLEELCVRVSAASPRSRRKKLAAASIYFFDTLGSLGEGKKIKRWHRVADFFETINVVGTSTYAIPYDGRTIRPEHIYLAWQIFCLKAPHFPSPVHKQDLNSLADQRNDVAHGHSDPVDVGGTMTIGDIRVRLSRLDDIAIHCVLAADEVWPRFS